jgi:RNA recognition motif-containing protein
MQFLTAALSTFRIRSKFFVSPAPRRHRASGSSPPSDQLHPRMQELRMNTKLYVGNIPFETTESDLQALFEGRGQVSTVNIVRDRATGQARGFAFVEMSDAEGAQRAIAELDRHQMGGRSLTVNEAKPMASRAGGGSGGGGGRQRREPRW